MGYGDNPPLFISGNKQLSLSNILSNIEDINALPINSLITNEYINIPDATSDEEKKNKTTEQQNKAPQVIVIERDAVIENDAIGLSLDDSPFDKKAEDIEVSSNTFISMSTSTNDKKVHLQIQVQKLKILRLKELNQH